MIFDIIFSLKSKNLMSTELVAISPLGADCVFIYLVNTSLNCLLTLINVVHLDNCLRLAAPTYVQELRKPPKISKIVVWTGPLYGTSTVRPSDERYSATPP